jgi:hypothetical protein
MPWGASGIGISQAGEQGDRVVEDHRLEEARVCVYFPQFMSTSLINVSHKP